MNTSEPSFLDYFSGGVPTGEYFRMTLADIRDLACTAPRPRITLELCFVGLISYFEAFCKDHFASLINIEPDLVVGLRASGQDTSVDAAHVVLYGTNLRYKLGFIVAETYDFGTPQKINALFGSLLRVTPFSKDEARVYTALLQDRNLFVHHGGTYSLSYLEQLGPPVPDIKDEAYWNSRALSPEEVLTAISFVESIARKTIRASHDAIKKRLENEGRSYLGERQKALDALLWWGS